MPEDNNQNHPYNFETIPYKTLLESSGTWEIISIKNYMNNTYWSFFSFITSDTLLVLGGLDTEHDEESYKGFLIDIGKKELLEEFTLKKYMFSEFTPSYYRGVIVGSSMLEGDYEDDEDQTYEFLNLDVERLLSKNNMMPYH